MARIYLVKLVSRATEANTNHAGEVNTSLYGKGEELLYSDSPDLWVKRDLLSWYFLNEYGYRRECDAKRNWLYRNQVDDPKWWTNEKEIVSIDVEPDDSETGIRITKNF